MATKIRLTADGRRFFALVKQLKRKPIVKQGYPADLAAETHSDSDLTVIFIAVVHEFGAPSRKIPERSHLRSSFDENKAKLSSFAFKTAGRIMDGSITLEQGMDQIGLMMVSNHKTKIRSGIPPELSESTLEARRRKGDSNPTALIDTAQMLNSSTHKRIMNS